MVNTANDRRLEILEAATRAFAHTPFNSTTMDDIALEAGVSKGTLYLYFRSKRELFTALYVHIALRQLAAMQEAARLPSPSQVERLRAVFAAVVQTYTTQPEYISLMPDLVQQVMVEAESMALTQMYNAQATQLIAGIIQAGIDENCFRPVDASLAAITVQNSVAGVLGRAMQQPEADLTASLDFFLDLVFNGLLSKGSNEHATPS
ncbi:MAG: TetR/AcrR family transcriptional regulator [Anaerolineae bacterium]|nr:TetR/AcrR family transcriptional regulator [Anaerolineae bacterium]